MVHGFPKSMNIGLAIDKKKGLQGQRGVGGFNVGGLGEQENRKAKLYIGSTTDGSKQKAYTDYKSDLAKKWKGWGSCLKPAFEPIIVGRKPFKGSLVDNVIKWGVGGLNIDECRVGEIGATKKNLSNVKVKASMTSFGGGQFYNGEVVSINQGRFPANLILTYEQMTFDEVCGGFPETKSQKGNSERYLSGAKNDGNFMYGSINETNSYNDSGSACRYFYCAKASKKDRDEGLNGFEYYELNENIDEEIKNNIKRLLNL